MHKQEAMNKYETIAEVAELAIHNHREWMNHTYINSVNQAAKDKQPVQQLVVNQYHRFLIVVDSMIRWIVSAGVFEDETFLKDNRREIAMAMATRTTGGLE